MSRHAGETSAAVGSLLREYREWAGYSRDSLAERVHISVDELERWEYTGVPVPLPERFRTLADFLDVPNSAVEAAVAGSASHLPRDRIEVYEAAPVIEDAIAGHGWTPEAIAEALATSPTKVQAWRLGVVEMTAAERLMLSGLVRLRNEPAAEER